MANKPTIGYAIFNGPYIERILETEMGVYLLAIFPTQEEAEKVNAQLFPNGQQKVFRVEIP